MEKTATQQRAFSNPIAIGFVLFLVATSVTMAQYKIPTIMTDIMAMFSIDAGTASWLMSIFTAIGIVLSLPTGSLTKKLGPKKVLLIGCAFSVAGSVVGAFAGSAAILIFSRANVADGSSPWEEPQRRGF